MDFTVVFGDDHVLEKCEHMNTRTLLQRSQVVLKGDLTLEH
jgi:hypothetical protein